MIKTYYDNCFRNRATPQTKQINMVSDKATDLS